MNKTKAKTKAKAKAQATPILNTEPAKEYGNDAKFKSLRIPLPLMYLYCMGRLNKSVFLASIFMYTLFKTHKQYSPKHNKYFSFKPVDLIREISLSRGEYTSELKKLFYSDKSTPNDDDNIINIRIETLLSLCITIDNKKNFKSDKFKKHTNFMGSEKAYTLVEPDLFEYIRNNKLNKIKLKIFLLILRKKNSVHYMRKPVFYSYLKEYTNTSDMKRIIKHTEDLHKKGIIEITNREEFDCKLSYLQSEEVQSNLEEQAIMDMI